MEFVTAGFWAAFEAAALLLFIMALSATSGFSGWWTLVAAMVAIGLVTLVPHGWSYLEQYFSDQPLFELSGKHSAENLSNLVQFRFWGGLSGCLVMFLVFELKFKKHF